MTNVARVFNDAVGVEVTQRTGKNPAYTYLSLGCSRNAEARMLAFARAQISKPFSNSGMARSVIWPRQTDGTSWFCAELVAAILKEGGLMSPDSNAGAATPYGLYKLYAKQAAATANPYTLRAVQHGLTLEGLFAHEPQRTPLLQPPEVAAMPVTMYAARSRSDSPPRAAFKLLSSRAPAPQRSGITLSLDSLGAAPRPVRF